MTVVTPFIHPLCYLVSLRCLFTFIRLNFKLQTELFGWQQRQRISVEALMHNLTNRVAMISVLKTLVIIETQFSRIFRSTHQ